MAAAEAEKDAFLANGQRGKDAEMAVEAPDEKAKCCTLKCAAVAAGVAVVLAVLLGVVGYLHYKNKYEGTAEATSQEDILRELEDEDDSVVISQATVADGGYPAHNFITGK